MKDISKNEMLFVLSIFKNPEAEYNANSIAKLMKISSMGALKIARKLEKQRVLLSRKLGKAIFYKLNFNNSYVNSYLGFLLKKEAEESSPYVKRWINEARKIKNAEIIVLFGSVLRNEKQANDIDLLVVFDKSKFSSLKKEIERINLLNDKKIHPIYQSESDLRENIKKQDKIVLNAIKGVVVFGEDKLIKLLT